MTEEFNATVFAAEVRALANRFNAICTEEKAPVVLVACLTLIEHGATLASPEDRKGIAITLVEVARTIAMRDAEPTQ